MNKSMSLADLNTACTLCSSPDLETVIDFGSQPPANRFIPENARNLIQESHPLALGYCRACGTRQLTQRMPIEAVRPRFAWLLYSEPEGHLDEATAYLAQLPGIGPQAKVLGVTYKDQSTLDRLACLGLPQGQCISKHDFGFESELFGLETIQQGLSDSKAITKIKAKYGVADILIMRHVIEHAHQAAKLISTLRELIAKDGYLMMELPDSEKMFKTGSHAFIWEEHISYFTEQSLRILAKTVGANLAWFKRYPYLYEDSLLVAFRFPAQASESSNLSSANHQADETLKKFSKDFDQAKHQWREKLSGYQRQGEKVAVFGAGHLAAKFVNFLDLKDLIDCVIDDNPNKAGMRMPGSLLPIVPSKELEERGIKICITTLNPESELKVRKKLSAYFNNGGQFLPAFAVQRSCHERTESEEN